MDRQLAERMVGAACILAVLVLVVPVILDGNPDSGATITHPAVDNELDLRTHTIRLDGADREPPVPMLRQAPAGTGSAQSAVEESVPAPPADARQDPIDEAAAQRAPSEIAPAAVETTVAAPAPPVAAPVSPAPARNTEGAGDWFVQLGSFSQRDNADRLAADLKSKGFSVSVLGGGGASGKLFRVRAGPVADRLAAGALAERLARAGFKGGHVGR